MINIAICDDDTIIVSKIEKLVLDIAVKNAIEVEVEAYYNGNSLLNDVRKGFQYDLIYLDIEMQDLNGISLARKIRENDTDLILIYVSNYDNYLRELFEVDTYRFLSKPIDEEVFEKYFLGAVKQTQRNTVYYSYRFNRTVYKVRVNDIMYFESSKRSITIYLKEDSVPSFYGKLNDVEQYLKKSKIQFLRIHQSYLVNYTYIKGFKMTNVELTDGQVLQISEDRQKVINIQYSKFLRKDLFDE